jgi:hypothetical protein
MNKYQTFLAVRDYHAAIARILFQVEQMIMQPDALGWEAEYMTQLIHDAVSAHNRMVNLGEVQ